MVIEMQTDLVKNLFIESIPENIALVEQFVEEIAEEYSIGEDIFGNMLISVTEAANNAMYHGNHCDVKKKVEISCIFLDAKNTLVYTIKDQGKGFNFNNIPDPTAPENIGKASGRGVFLMRQLADMFSFSNDGNTVELHFKL